jgi:hypothetical protein
MYPITNGQLLAIQIGNNYGVSLNGKIKSVKLTFELFMIY